MNKKCKSLLACLKKKSRPTKRDGWVYEMWLNLSRVEVFSTGELRRSQPSLIQPANAQWGVLINATGSLPVVKDPLWVFGRAYDDCHCNLPR